MCAQRNARTAGRRRRRVSRARRAPVESAIHRRRRARAIDGRSRGRIYVFYYHFSPSSARVGGVGRELHGCDAYTAHGCVEYETRTPIERGSYPKPGDPVRGGG